MLFLAAAACNRQQAVPFPFSDPLYPQPTSRAFAFTAPVNAQWTDLSVRPCPAPASRGLNLDELPSQPFYLDGYTPLPKPATESLLDWDRLPDTALDLRSIPATAFDPEYMLLGEPEIIQIKNPRVPANATEGMVQLTDYEGLPSKEIYSMLQSRQGGMWLASENSIARVSGHLLELFPRITGLVYKMVEDSAGLLWMQGQNGLYFMNSGARFAGHLDLGAGDAVMIDHTGLVWVGTFNNGIYIIDPVKKQMRHLFSRGNFPLSRVNRILEDRSGRIWICTQHSGMLVIDQTGRMKHLSMAGGLAENMILDVMEDRDHRFWICHGAGGVDVADPGNKKITHFGRAQGMSGSVMFNSLQDSSGTVWVHSDSAGVFLFHPDLSAIKHLTRDNGLAGNLLTFLMQDAAGEVWLSGLAGINIFDKNSPVIRNLFMGNGITDENVWGIYEDPRARIWMGNYHGVDLYDPVTRRMSLLNKASGLHNEREDKIAMDRDGHIWLGGVGPGLDCIDTLHHTISHWGEAQGLRIGNIAEIFSGPDGKLWVGTYDGRVARFDPRAQTVMKLELPGDLKDHVIEAFVGLPGGNVLFTVRGTGIFSVSADGKQWQFLGKKQGLSSDQLTSLIRDSRNNLWVGTEDGLDVLDLNSNRARTYSEREGMPGNSVFSIAKYGNDVYLGTNEGIALFSPARDSTASPRYTISVIAHDEGLPLIDFNQATVLVKKNGESYWGASPAVSYLKPIRPDSARQPPLITGMSILNKPQNFASRKDLAKFFSGSDSVWKPGDKTSFPFSSVPPDSGYLQLAHITWDSLQGPFNLPMNLRLPAAQNFVSIRFGTARVKDGDKLRYRYLLQGVDKNWSLPTANNSSEEYRDLPAGDYTFLVRCRVRNGPWSEPASFSFRIVPPWYRTFWAYGLYALLAIAAVWAIVRVRSRRLRAENLRLESMVGLRTSELSASLADLKSTQAQLIQSEKMASLGELTAGIAHEIQNPLNFVNNFSEVNTELIDEMRQELKAGHPDEAAALAADIKLNMEKIIHHGKRADAIVKGMLQHSRVSDTHKEPADLNALADEYLRLSYHGLRAKDKSFNVALETSFDPSVGMVPVVGQDIGRVLLNLFNNAFYSVAEKKGSAADEYKPLVTVSTKRSGDKVEIRVRDNGTGIPGKILDKIYQPFFTTKPVGQGTGLGLSLSYDIVVKIHQGELKVDTREQEFTEFLIVLPAR